MVSRNRLCRRRTMPLAAGEWVLDSGGFTELQQHGRWRSSARQYARDIERFSEAGKMQWAAPQDWMCEPAIIQGGRFKGGTFVGTGLSVREHQHRTVGNYLDLKALGAPVIPVLQGFTLADYERCAAMYDGEGVDLAAEPVVGLGSVCRREDSDEIGEIVRTFHAEGFRLHGFGCKMGAVRRYGPLLESADSMAWSLWGRYEKPCPVRGVSSCGNCLHFALSWRRNLLEADA